MERISGNSVDSLVVILCPFPHRFRYSVNVLAATAEDDTVGKGAIKILKVLRSQYST